MNAENIFVSIDNLSDYCLKQHWTAVIQNWSSSFRIMFYNLEKYQVLIYY